MHYRRKGEKGVRLREKLFQAENFGVANAGRSSFLRCLTPFFSALMYLLIVLTTACHTDMYDQPRYDLYEQSKFFKDKATSQLAPENTIARGDLELDDHFYRGKVNGELATELPMAVTEKLLRRGQERFQIFCSPCHGQLGNGRGMIVERGMKQPASFHDARLQKAPAGYFFDVMTNGFGVMYDYRERIEPADRWAIVAYIRALQLSQAAPVSSLPAKDVLKLQGQDQSKGKERKSND